MTSRRRVIQQAMVDKLAAINVAGGFNTNVDPAAGGGGAFVAGDPKLSFATLPALVVSFPNEDKADARSTYWHNEVAFVVVAYVEASDTVPAEYLLEDLVEDIERVLLAEKALDPPLGVSGVEDLVLNGHTKGEFSSEEWEGLVLVVQGQIEYVHDREDSGAWTGAGI